MRSRPTTKSTLRSSYQHWGNLLLAFQGQLTTCRLMLRSVWNDIHCWTLASFLLKRKSSICHMKWMPVSGGSAQGCVCAAVWIQIHFLQMFLQGCCCCFEVFWLGNFCLRWCHDRTTSFQVPANPLRSWAQSKYSWRSKHSWIRIFHLHLQGWRELRVTWRKAEIILRSLKYRQRPKYGLPVFRGMRPCRSQSELLKPVSHSPGRAKVRAKARELQKAEAAAKQMPATGSYDKHHKIFWVSFFVGTKNDVFY